MTRTMRVEIKPVSEYATFSDAMRELCGRREVPLAELGPLIVQMLDASETVDRQILVEPDSDGGLLLRFYNDYIE